MNIRNQRGSQIARTAAPRQSAPWPELELPVRARATPLVGNRLVFARSASKPMLQSPQRHRARIPAEPALPHNGDSPPSCEQVPLRTVVPLHVAIEFRLPELGPCRRGGRVGTSGMAVPETAMNEANRTVATEDKIRCSRETPDMEPESKPPCVEPPSKDKLGPRVLGGYARHHSRSRSPVHNVGHRRGGAPTRKQTPTISRQVAAWGKWRCDTT